MSSKHRKLIFNWTVSLLAFLLVLFFVIFFPFFTAPGKGSFVEKLRRDNATVSGTVSYVIGVGPFGVGKRPLIVGYYYLGFYGKQTVPVTDAGKFKAGKKIIVEYSHVRPGMSRIKGYGTGSVYISETKELLWFYLGPFGFFISASLIGLWLGRALKKLWTHTKSAALI